MRELVYLSERKLTQFREDTQRRWWGRVTQWGAVAPLGMGEVNVTLGGRKGEEAAVDLRGAIRHIKRIRPRPPSYRQGQVEPGRWVHFQARLNYAVITKFRGPPVLLFWEPEQIRDKRSPQLLLHGSPYHLTPIVEQIPLRHRRISRSISGNMMNLLRDMDSRPQSDYGATSMASRLFYDVCGGMSPDSAALMSGYARASLFVLGKQVGNFSEPSLILASPLYVEYSS